MADVRVTYDKTVDAAYIYLAEPQARVKSARMYPCAAAAKAVEATRSKHNELPAENCESPPLPSSVSPVSGSHPPPTAQT